MELLPAQAAGLIGRQRKRDERLRANRRARSTRSGNGHATLPGQSTAVATPWRGLASSRAPSRYES